MKFSVKSDYAVIAAIDLALNYGEGPLQVRTISKRQGISEKFLEQVMNDLKKAGLVESIRGSQGGYILAHPPEKISLAMVLEAIEGNFAPMNCVARDIKGTCWQETLCVVKDVWEDIKLSIKGILDSVTLKEMCERKIKKESSRHLMYHI